MKIIHHVNYYFLLKDHHQNFTPVIFKGVTHYCKHGHPLNINGTYLLVFSFIKLSYRVKCWKIYTAVESRVCKVFRGAWEGNSWPLSCSLARTAVATLQQASTKCALISWKESSLHARASGSIVSSFSMMSEQN